MAEDKKYIFISYSRKDQRIVNKVVDILKESGYAIWIDVSGIESGEQFKHVIVNAIEKCEIFLYFASKNSNTSPWTAKEVGIATSLKKRIIPIRLDNSAFNKEILFDIVNLNYIDLTKVRKLKEDVVPLINTIAKHLPVNEIQTDSPVQSRSSKSSKYIYPVIAVLCLLACLFCSPWFMSRINLPGDEMREILDHATRGVIFDSKDNIIAANHILYDLHFDPSAVDKSVWNAESRKLAQGLSALLPDKNAPEWWEYLNNAREKNRKYLPIANGTTQEIADSLRTLPIFCKGHTGGFILTTRNVRLYPYGDLAHRTIGSSESGNSDGNKFGIEGSYDKELAGRDGIRRIKVGKRWGRIHQWDMGQFSPLHGHHLQVTLDMGYQVVADNMLRKAISHNEDITGGCLAIMEAASGEIKALANIHRTEEGEVGEYYNYFMSYSYEAQEFLHPMLLTAALSDGLIGPSDIHKPASEIAKHYVESPDYLYDWYKSLCISRSECDLQELTETDIVKGGDFKVTPVQILSFYNALANKGRMMKPMLVKRITDSEKCVLDISPEELTERSFSSDVADKVISALQSDLTPGPEADRHMINVGTYVRFYPARNPDYTILCMIRTDSKGNAGHLDDVPEKIVNDILDNLHLPHID